MAKRKATGKGSTKKKSGLGRKAAIGGPKSRTGKKRGGRNAGRGNDPRSVQPRVWRRTARLAQDALSALETGNLAQVRQYLHCIQAVAECADER